MSVRQEPTPAGNPLVVKDERPALALCDESKAECFSTGGLLWLPAVAADAAATAIAAIKERRSIPSDARIHCRVLFSGDARRRSAFAHLSPDDAHEILVESVDAMRGFGGLWFGAWVDRTRYPEYLQLMNGERFDVGEKHLAGLVCSASVATMEHHIQTPYRLAFDPDPTKIDWGLARMQQATHFARTHPNAIALPQGQESLLEMADVAAYTLGQSLLAGSNPKNWKAVRFAALLKLMKMRSAQFTYTPWLRPQVA